jgi:hypothetical protein
LANNRENIDDNPGKQALEKALRREWYARLLSCYLLASAGLIALWYGILVSAIIGLFGLLIAALGCRFLFQSLKGYKSGEHRLIRLFKESPRSIVWVYSVVTERMPFGLQIARAGTMYFKLIDGDEISVSLPAKELKVVADHLQPLLPHASFGYSRDREQWYLADPQLLILDPEGKRPERETKE